MVERIRTLLETRQLTPTQFADVIGIARPIVSHVLSGRNKPSLEVVQRILAAMPDLSMAWLLNGTGPMLAATAEPLGTAPAIQTALHSQAADSEAANVESEQLAPPASSSPAPVAPNRRNTPAANPVPATVASTVVPRPAPKRFRPATSIASPASTEPTVTPPPLTENQAILPTLEPELKAAAKPVKAISDAPETSVAGSAALAPSVSAAALFTGAEKPIRRIVIFYRDGSFADYQPE